MYVTHGKRAGTCGFANCQTQANDRVAEGHDSSHNGQEPQPVKVGDLTKQDLKGTEDQHERVVGNLQQGKRTLAHRNQTPDQAHELLPNKASSRPMLCVCK